MAGIRQIALPAWAMLHRYELSGDYTDCFTTTLPRSASQAELIEAFYCTWLFKLERRILAAVVKQPSSDDDAKAVALGSAKTLAAWRVEEQRAEQLLMCDFQDRTRHWLMAKPHGNATDLYFGSAVIKGGPNRGVFARFIFGALGGFHILYSRLLLSAAARKLTKS